LIRGVLAADNDPRKVAGAEHARYFGAELTDTSLTAGPDARLGKTSFAIGSPTTTSSRAAPETMTSRLAIALLMITEVAPADHPGAATGVGWSHLELSDARRHGRRSPSTFTHHRFVVRCVR
jgi:hypothetical protein